MRILQIISSFDRRQGGSVTTMAHMTSILCQAGFTVEILTCHDDKPAEPFLPVPVFSFPKSFPARLANSAQALAHLRANAKSYDIVCIHCIWTALSIRAAHCCIELGVPYIVVPHGSLDPFDLQKKRLLKSILGPILLRKVLQQAWCILCSTPREASKLVCYGAKARTRLLSWPVPHESGDISRAAARDALNIPEGDFVILSLGRVDYKKGFPILIPAFQRLRESQPNARLLIVGPDTNGYTEEVRSLISAHRVSDAVTLYPHANPLERLRFQRAADCFALPSLNENFGNTVVEAMQQGLPCVISDNVYLSDMIAAADAGEVCSYSENSLYQCLATLAADPARRKTLASAGIAFAKKFLPEVVMEEYRSLLLEVTSTAERQTN